MCAGGHPRLFPPLLKRGLRRKESASTNVIPSLRRVATLAGIPDPCFVLEDSVYAWQDFFKEAGPTTTQPRRELVIVDFFIRLLLHEREGENLVVWIHVVAGCIEHLGICPGDVEELPTNLIRPRPNDQLKLEVVVSVPELEQADALRRGPILRRQQGRRIPSANREAG